MATRPIRVWSGSDWEDVAIAPYDSGEFLSAATASATYIPDSIVNAKGDLVTATANDTPAILTAGSNGQMLMADSSATTGLRYVDPPTNRNLLINGNFSVWQRGTSFTNPGAIYLADRWRLETNASAGTVSQQAFAVGQTDVPGNPTYFLRVAMDAGATGVYRPVQRIEAPDAFSGRQVTLSFYAKTANTGVISQVYLSQDGFASGARTDTRIDGTGATGVVLTSSWQRFTMTGTFPSTSGKTLNASTYASVEFYMKEVANTSIDLANVQLEFGPVATPFEFEPYEATLRKCQRYYARYDVTTSITVGFGAAYSTTAAEISMPARPQMRTTPASIDYANLQLTDQNSNTNATSAALAGRSGKDQLSVAVTVASGLTSNRPYWLRGSADGYIAFSAEL